MDRITAIELLERMIHRTAGPFVPKEHSSREYSRQEVQEAVATLATCVNRIALLLKKFLESNARGFVASDQEYPIRAE